MSKIHPYWQYWRNPPKKNAPEAYLASVVWYSKYLVRLIREQIDTPKSILEIGCNVGKNLIALSQSGYTGLAGIEINADAIALMRKTYPEAAKETQIWIAPVEEVIKDFKDDSFDLIFTIAVLEHIGYDSDFIFAEIARIAGKFLILIEGEDAFQRGRYFGRSYQPIFEELGMVQVYQENLTQRKKIGSKTTWTRIFKKK